MDVAVQGHVAAVGTKSSGMLSVVLSFYVEVRIAVDGQRASGLCGCSVEAVCRSIVGGVHRQRRSVLHRYGHVAGICDDARVSVAGFRGFVGRYGGILRDRHVGIDHAAHVGSRGCGSGASRQHGGHDKRAERVHETAFFKNGPIPVDCRLPLWSTCQKPPCLTACCLLETSFSEYRKRTFMK